MKDVDEARTGFWLGKSWRGGHSVNLEAPEVSLGGSWMLYFLSLILHR